MKSSSDFILFGQGNYNTLGVLHQLAEIGVDPLILSVGNPKDKKNGNIIGYSKYAKRIEIVGCEDEGLKWILSNRDKFAVDTVIYPTSDTAELLLDSNFDSLSTQFRFPNAGKQKAVVELMDKHCQADLAREAGIRILESQYSNSPNFSFSNVVYPCMVKPLNSTTGSKGDMKVCENEDELRAALQGGKLTSDFIVQQYLNNEADLLFLGVAFDNGDVWLPAVVIKPGVTATGEYSHAIISTDVEKYLPEMEQVKAFVSGIGYRGPFSIEFGLEKGKNYFFEINLRNDGTSQYPLSAGVNIAEAYINGKPSQSMPKIEYDMIDEVCDIKRVIRREIAFAKWLRTFRNAGSYRFYRKGDRSLIPILTFMLVSRVLGKLL